MIWEVIWNRGILVFLDHIIEEQQVLFKQMGK